MAPLVLIAAALLETGRSWMGRVAGFTEGSGEVDRNRGRNGLAPKALAHHLYVARVWAKCSHAGRDDALPRTIPPLGALINLGSAAFCRTYWARGRCPRLLETQSLGAMDVWPPTKGCRAAWLSDHRVLGFPMGPFPDPAILISDSPEPLLRPLGAEPRRGGDCSDVLGDRRLV